MQRKTQDKSARAARPRKPEKEKQSSGRFSVLGRWRQLPEEKVILPLDSQVVLAQPGAVHRLEGIQVLSGLDHADLAGAAEGAGPITYGSCTGMSEVEQALSASSRKSGQRIRILLLLIILTPCL